MQRLRLYDLRVSRLPGVIGACVSDTLTIASYANAADRRLIMCKEAGEESWYGTWAEMVFTVSRANPYLTTPRNVARLEAVVICDQPVPIYNPFYEYLLFGNGRLPKQFIRTNRNCLMQVMSRNSVPTFVDLSNGPQLLRSYSSSDADNATRIFYQGTDNNDRKITSMDGADRVQGVFYQNSYPFNTTLEQFNGITGIQKDQTVGQVDIFQVDPTTGEEVLLVTMEPSETTASYRRYYFSNLPRNCCNNNDSDTVQLRAICKLEPLPVYTDTDYLVIQNLDALIEECKAVRYAEMDTVAAKQMSSNAHKEAVGYLNGELTHYYGETRPSVIVKPYGSADLRKQRIGTMT